MKSSWYFVRSVSPVNVRVPVIGSVQQTLSTERHVANKAFSLRLPFSRNVCSMSGDTQLQAIWKYLTTNGPSFPVESKNVTFVEGPREFLQELKVATLAARKNIVLSSLYLGTDSCAQDFVETLTTACTQNSNLQVTVLLDYLRALREQKRNSFTMLKPLLERFPNRINFHLYHTPMLRGLLKLLLPKRVNEIVGVQHIKAYIFDDDVLISGANLAETYFTCRQDRYYWIRNNEDLSNYFKSLVRVMSNLSYSMDATGRLKLNSPFDPTKESRQYREWAHKQLSSCLTPTSPVQDYSSSDTWIFPTLQMGVFNIRHDEHMVSYLLENAAPGSTLTIASPYLNLAANYKKLILSGHGNVDIVTASPKANGFFAAKDISKFVPAAYSAVEHDFYQAVNHHGQQKRISMYEYARNDWTYHGKGFWYRLPGETLPSVTLIGSGNLGRRSAERDTEAQIVILTTNSDMKQQFEKERLNVCSFAQKVDDATFNDPERKSKLWLQFTTKALSDFL